MILKCKCVEICRVVFHVHLRATLALIVLLLQSSHAQDWCDQFKGSTRILNQAFQQDPLDFRVTFRGSGEINIGQGLARFRQSPRLYVANDPRTALSWGDVEMTGYATMIDSGNTTSTSAGFTMAARTNHDEFQIDGCQAFGYYARITLLTGDCLFTKEYYHGSNYTVYAPSIRVPCFPSGLPLNQEIGMKFRVVTVTGTSNVRLELYTDMIGDGSWILRHEYMDEPGKWPSVSSPTIPLACAQTNGDTVLRPGNICFFRADGTNASVVHWRNASIQNNVSQVFMEMNTSCPATLLPTVRPTTLPASSSSAEPTASNRPSIATCSNKATLVVWTLAAIQGLFLFVQS